MNKLIKLISLIVISMSVYLIYNKTSNSYYQITSIGDKLSIGNNNNRLEKNYIDYYKEYIKKEKNKVIVEKSLSKDNQSINSVLLQIKSNPEMKRKIINSNLIIITLGYNDLVYNLAIEENRDDITRNKIIKEIKKEYNDLISEIKKYYHKEIIVVGYCKSSDDYLDKGIVELNKILKSNKKIHYIDTYYLLNNKTKYYINSRSNYPNNRGYYEITKKIISKTLEIC